MQTWRDAQTVFGAIDGVPGTVVAVDETARTFSVRWQDSHAVGNVKYPFETIMVRAGMPWEI